MTVCCLHRRRSTFEFADLLAIFDSFRYFTLRGSFSILSKDRWSGCLCWRILDLGSTIRQNFPWNYTVLQFLNIKFHFNLLNRENKKKHCFQSNLAESLKIAGNIFSCSPPPTHSPSQVSKSSKLVTICEREALQMVSDAWNTLSKLLYQYTFPFICCKKKQKQI